MRVGINKNDACLPEKPRVSIVMPCRNEADHIANCVAGLLALEAPLAGFEVVVADGMSTDGTREILARLEREAGGQQLQTKDYGLRTTGQKEAVSRQSSVVSRQRSEVSSQWSVFRIPALRVIDNPGRITPCGLNAAIRAARGEIIVRADSHTTYAVDYLLKCLETLQQTRADNVGGPARTKADGYRQRAVAAAYHSPFSVGGARFHDIAFDGYVDTVTYGCWPRSTFERFGLFDEELVRNQDDEHNLRIIRGGGKVYQSSEIKSWYRPRSSFTSLFNQYMQYGYWKVRVIQKHKLPASWRHLVPGAFVFMLLLLALASVLFAVVPSFAFHFPSSVHRLPLLGLCSLAFVYACAVLMASIMTAAKAEWKLLPVLPAVFGCYHLGYGCGFLRGVLDFVILRRNGSTAFAKLTRGSSNPNSLLK